MANHKNKRPRAGRAGCKLCKPWKRSRPASRKLRDRRLDAPKEEA